MIKVVRTGVGRQWTGFDLTDTTGRRADDIMDVLLVWDEQVSSRAAWEDADPPEQITLMLARLDWRVL